MTLTDLVAAGFLIAVVATAVVSGVFFAFSSFVMPALARQASRDGIAAMQSINITAVRPAFMSLLFGTAALTAAVGIAGFGDPRVVIGAALYLVGVIGVTIAAHVPRNNALAAIDRDAPQAESAWRRYLTGWRRWNHVRWIAAGASSAAFLTAVAG
ncbi:anthrone oxygenase family protein [Microbacterium sp. K24]|uniref:anthrone oxygenase family protein n=1 Tax=Microbacterium sp. K24 TaxID=2305446 RepID=UPI00109C1277|nr:anthrone oxygenase family protein [Microbacterium sp. K24]